MRIDGNRRLAAASRGKGARTSATGEGGFELPAQGSSQQAPGSAADIGITGIGALMALQSVDGAEERGERVRHGMAMLGLLEDMKLELLSGEVSAGRLEHLVDVVGKRPERHPDERVEAVLDEIELRARVELAKFGRIAA